MRNIGISASSTTSRSTTKTSSSPYRYPTISSWQNNRRQLYIIDAQRGAPFSYCDFNCWFSRSDGQLRHTSTSTSNYNTSASDMPAYLRGFDSSLQTRKDGKNFKFVFPTNKWVTFLLNTIFHIALLGSCSLNNIFLQDEGRRRRKRATTDREATGQTGEEATEATDSDSDSARSLDLASSHSSDDDETSTRRSSHPPSANRKYIKITKI